MSVASDHVRGHHAFALHTRHSLRLPRQYLPLAAGHAGIEVAIDSAGTGDWHVGNPPDRRAIATAHRHGIDISGYRARQIVRTDFTRFTHIFALDHDNLANVRRLATRDGTAEIALLLDLVGGRQGEAVVDPYYGEAAGFEQTWADVTAAAAALVARLGG